MFIAANQEIPIGGFTGPGIGVFNTIGLDPCGSLALNNLNGIISLIVGFLTVLAGLIFMLYFIFGGIQWTLAGGDSGKVDTAKKQMTNGAIGLIIVIVSYGIIAVVGSVVGLNILDPATIIKTQLSPGSCGATNPATPGPK